MIIIIIIIIIIITKALSTSTMSNQNINMRKQKVVKVSDTFQTPNLELKLTFWAIENSAHDAKYIHI